MKANEEYAIDRTGSLWDRLRAWRGRSSSHRRAIANAGLHAAQCAAALREAARLIDTAPSDRRKAEGLTLVLQIRDLASNMNGAADHLEDEFRRG